VEETAEREERAYRTERVVNTELRFGIFPIALHDPTLLENVCISRLLTPNPII